MRIAFISAMESAPWGGSEYLWSGTAEELAADGHQVFASVKYWEPEPAILQKIQRAGVKISHRCKDSSRSTKNLEGYSRHSTASSKDIQQWLKRTKPDFVCISHGHYRDGLHFMELCLSLNIPYASIVQANAEFLWPFDELADRLVEVYQSAHAIYCVSQGNLRLLQNQLAVELTNASIVHNPYNINRHADISWPKHTSIFRLACVARLEPGAKGQDIIIEILNSSNWRKRPLIVTFFGNGSFTKGIHRLIDRYRLTSQIRIEGYVEDITFVWRENHGLILPSRFEGLPLSLVEAQIAGRMAIVTDVAGNCEIVKDNETGFVASSASINDVSEAMERAWQNRLNWENIGKKARQNALKKIPFNPCRTFAELLLKNFSNN